MEVGKKSTTENKENIQFKEVVRIFLLQSISYAEIDNEIKNLNDIRNLNFIKTVLIQKSGNANNPNQIMPIGGNIENGESLSTAAKREALEETHLILSDLKKLESTQKYQFEHNGKKSGRISHFFLGNLFPPKFDVPYALDSESDKIEQFIYLGLNNLQELFKTGKYNGKNILDSLNPDEKVRAAAKTISDSKEIETLQKELVEQVKLSEVKRKLEIMQVLITKDFKIKSLPLISEILNHFQAELGKVNDSGEIEKLYQNVKNYWRENILDLCGNVENLKAAIRFSNVNEILQDTEQDENKIGNEIPTIHMMFPILFGFNFDKKLITLLEKNLHLKKIYVMSRVLFLYNISNGNTPERDANAAKRMLFRILEKEESFAGMEQVNEKRIIDFFKKLGFLSADFENSFRTLGGEVDSFFSDLQSKSKINPNVAYLSHSNEVEGKNFERIIMLAFGPEKNKSSRQIKFESQRKLLLCMLLHEAKKYYEEIKEKGITELDDLEAKLETNDSSPVFGLDGGRKINLNGKEYDVIIERRTKELNSTLRKVLVRDDWSFDTNSPYNDIYGESYVFDEKVNGKMEEIKAPAPCKMSDSKGKEISEFKAPKIVHEFLVEIVRNSLESDKNEQIEILQFKELPAEGGKMDSNSVGGGGKIRMCKFYLKHIDKIGVERVREVQMFLPRKLNGEWISGKVDYDFKKKDDERYAITRLFTHGNIYSLIELLFPYEIYGDKMKEFFKT